MMEDEGVGIGCRTEDKGIGQRQSYFYPTFLNILLLRTLFPLVCLGLLQCFGYIDGSMNHVTGSTNEIICKHKPVCLFPFRLFYLEHT